MWRTWFGTTVGVVVLAVALLIALIGTAWTPIFAVAAVALALVLLGVAMSGRRRRSEGAGVPGARHEAGVTPVRRGAPASGEGDVRDAAATGAARRR